MSTAIAFLIVLLLTSMALGSYFVAAVDSHVSMRNLRSTQCAYIAEAGIEYIFKKMNLDEAISNESGVEVETGNFDLDVSHIGHQYTIISAGHAGSSLRRIQIEVYYRRAIGNFAIYTTGDVNNVQPIDEDGNPDPDLMLANADSLPPIDYAGLVDMAINQSHVQLGASFEPADGYPNGSFYYSGSTPNVTHVTGDLKVKGGRTVYGIFLVEGDAILEGNTRVEGVIYLQNPGNIVIHGGGDPSESSVTGGVIANGDVNGTGSHITVHYSNEYMKIFENFEDRQDALRLLSWRDL